MTITSAFRAIRINSDNPNHHLWNNHGAWWVHFTVHHADHTKERIRLSLATRDLQEARRRRDQFFRNDHQFSITIEGIELRER